MTHIIFYSNLADKHLTLVSLVQQALDKRHLVTIMADSEQAASQVNSTLWGCGASSFLPNTLATHTYAVMTPVLIDWQQTKLMRCHTHATYCVSMQCCIQVWAAFQKASMNNEGATLDRLDVSIRQDVSVEINLQ